MRIGVDYYPEHWEESRWPVDAKLMREAGISVVRLAEFAWCKMEPYEGRFDFSWLDKAIKILKSEGIEVVLGTPTATPPAWLCERYPDIYPADARGYRRGFGTRLHRCMNNPVMRRYSRLITQAMVSHFKDNPAVIGWQTDNEFEGNLCYCDVCAEKFREHLRQKFGTLDALNAAWGTIFWSQEYSAWSQIPLPVEARCGQSHNPSLKLEYRRFASNSTVEFQHEQVEIIRSLAPHQFITHNYMGLAADSVDYFELGKDLDFVSWDCYPCGSYDSYPRMDIHHDAIRGIKQKNVWMMEAQSGIPGWEKMGRRPLDQQIRHWSWQAIAHGADTVVYFRWRSCLYGTEQYWQGILNHDGVPRRRYNVVKQFGQELKQLSPELDGTVVRNDVAILSSYEQAWAYQVQPQTDGLGWWEQTRRYYDSLRRLGVGVDIVPMSVDLTQYKLVILPGWYVMTEEIASKLKSYVEQGGTLILSPRTGVKNSDNACLTECLPGMLTDLTGVEVDDYDAMGTAESRVRTADGKEYVVSVWADALILKGAEAVATYTRPLYAGETAIARNRYGSGTAYYFGTFGEPAFYDDMLSRIMSDADIDRLAGLPDGVDASWRTKDGSSYLFLINLTGDEKKIPAKAGLQPLLGPAPDCQFIALPPYEVGVYKEVQSASDGTTEDITLA